MSCVREPSPSSPSGDSDISRHEVKRKKFRALRGLRRIFRRKGRPVAAAVSDGQVDVTTSACEDEVRVSKYRRSILCGARSVEKEERNITLETSRSHSASHVMDDPEEDEVQEQRRGFHSTLLSVSHDSIFSPEHRSADSDSESSSLYNRRISFPHSSIRAELFEAVRRRRVCDNGSDDEDLGLPRSPISSSPTTAEDLFSKTIIITKSSQSTCSDGSLLSMESSEMEEDLFGGRSSRNSSRLSPHNSCTERPAGNAEKLVGGARNSGTSGGLLSHNAAKHKLAVKPKRTHGLPQRKKQVGASTLPATPELNEDTPSRIPSVTEDHPITIVAETKSDKHNAQSDILKLHSCCFTEITSKTSRMGATQPSTSLPVSKPPRTKSSPVTPVSNEPTMKDVSEDKESDIFPRILRHSGKKKIKPIPIPDSVPVDTSDLALGITKNLSESSDKTQNEITPSICTNESSSNDSELCDSPVAELELSKEGDMLNKTCDLNADTTKQVHTTVHDRMFNLRPTRFLLNTSSKVFAKDELDEKPSASFSPVVSVKKSYSFCEQKLSSANDFAKNDTTLLLGRPRHKSTSSEKDVYESKAGHEKTEKSFEEPTVPENDKNIWVKQLSPKLIRRSASENVRTKKLELNLDISPKPESISAVNVSSSVSSPKEDSKLQSPTTFKYPTSLYEASHKSFAKITFSDSSKSERETVSQTKSDDVIVVTTSSYSPKGQTSAVPPSTTQPSNMTPQAEIPTIDKPKPAITARPSLNSKLLKSSSHGDIGVAKVASSNNVVFRRKVKENSANKDEEPELMKVFARRSLKLKESDVESLAAPVRSRESDKENEELESPPGAKKETTRSEFAASKPISKDNASGSKPQKQYHRSISAETEHLSVVLNAAHVEKRQRNKTVPTDSYDIQRIPKVEKEDVSEEVSQPFKRIQQRREEWEKRVQLAMKVTSN